MLVEKIGPPTFEITMTSVAMSAFTEAVEHEAQHRVLDVDHIARALIKSNLMQRYVDYAEKAGVSKAPISELATQWAEVLREELRES